jgi:hypothetical protein
MSWDSNSVLGYVVVGGVVYTAAYYLATQSRQTPLGNYTRGNDVGYHGNIPPPPPLIRNPQGGEGIYGYFRQFWNREPKVHMEL